MRRGARTMLWTTGGCVAAAAAVAVSTAGAAAPPRQVRLGHGPRIATGSRVIGALPAGARMQITVTLKPRDPSALAAFAKAVSSPGSASYHDYVRPAQFAQRFGATAAQLRAVQASLRAHGLRPGPVSRNRLSLDLTATAAQLGRAFSLSFRRVELEGGRQATVASAGPAVDSGIAGDVQAVLGLSTVSVPRPLSQRSALSSASSGAGLSPLAKRPGAATGGPQPCAAASSAASQQGAYTADQIASAYRFSGLYGAGYEGQGETIGVYELEPDDPADIAAYQACYGTSVPVSYVEVDGGAGTGPGEGEAALDIEQVIGLAPRAKVLVYQGPNSNSNSAGSGPYDTWRQIITDDRAQVVTNSWGQCEPMEGSADAAAESTLFQEAAAQGQSILSAAGDEGAEDCNGSSDVPSPTLAVDDPASQPFVTGVGGTTLNSLGPPPSEVVWNDGGNPLALLSVVASGAGGGGVSQLWGMPGYQSGALGSLHVIQADSSGSSCGATSGDCREVPDVSADADPNTGYIIYFNGSGSDATEPSGWQAIGGTSAAAPVWAALLADVNSSSACNGSPVGFANPALYRAAATDYRTDFNDITSGNNDFTGTNGGLYPAGPDYDMASGLGTPNAAGLASALCTGTLLIDDPGAQTSIVGRPVHLQIRTNAAAGTSFTYAASGLPAGLSISRSTGLISGRPQRAAVTTVSVAALGQNGGLRGSSFRWTVQGKPTISGATLTGVGSGRPKLQLTVTAGRYAPALTAVSLSPPTGARFARAPKHVTVTGAGGKRVRFSSRLVRGHLVIKLASAVSRIQITVSYAAIAASGSLSSRARTHRTTTVQVTVAATDATRHTTTVKSRAKIIS